MAIKYKVNIMDELKENGYTSYRIRKEKLFGEATLQMFRRGEYVASGNNLDILCKILKKQPGDLIEYIPDKD